MSEQVKYQEEIFNTFRNFMPPANFPVYPPYHQGLYLEELFCKQYLSFVKDKNPQKLFIPVHWTNCYKRSFDMPVPGLQTAIDGLDTQYEYFVVCTHDDAPRERLPTGTTVYAAGGNAGGIPIPLGCSDVPESDLKEQERDIFASFIGSTTHPIRYTMFESIKSDSKYHIKLKRWTPDVNQEQQNYYKDIMRRSEFALCPRGYGATSYRMYEAMQFGAIPVYISDKFWIPFEKDVNWYEFCVIVPESRIDEMDFILSAISESQKQSMREKMKEAYKEHFAAPKIINKIVKEVCK